MQQELLMPQPWRTSRSCVKPRSGDQQPLACITLSSSAPSRRSSRLAGVRAKTVAAQPLLQPWGRERCRALTLASASSTPESATGGPRRGCHRSPGAAEALELHPAHGLVSRGEPSRIEPRARIHEAPQVAISLMPVLPH